MSVITCITVALVSSYLLSFKLVPLLMVFAQRYQIVDKPDGIVKFHTKVTPYLGGVAVFGGFLGALLITGSIANIPFLFLLGLLALLVVGVIDDIYTLTAWQKLLGQYVAALILFAAGLYLKEFFLRGHWLLKAASLLWILSVTNAINLIDVMDGLTAVITIGASGTLVCVAIALGQPDIAVVCAALCGAVIAFFGYNKPPARIFLGDAGALFIGGFLAGAPFLICWGINTPVATGAPLIMLTIPLVELGFLIIIRTAKGIPFWRASKDHFKHYLQSQGWQIKEILGYVAFMQFILGISTIYLVSNFIMLKQVFILGSLFLGNWIGVIYPICRANGQFDALFLKNVAKYLKATKSNALFKK